MQIQTIVKIGLYCTQTSLPLNLFLSHLYCCALYQYSNVNFSTFSQHSDDEENGKVLKDEIPKKKLQDLEKLCEKCQRKMSVKFDFDKMESDGDPEAWVVFSCSMCTSREDLNESGSE